MTEELRETPHHRLCLFWPTCGRVVTLLYEPRGPWGAESRYLVPAHDVKHPVLTGPCPASLQPVGHEWNGPAPLSVQTMLLQQKKIWQNKIPALIMEGDIAEERRKRDRRKPPPESTSLRQPTRIGREPEPDAEEWHLGGREDEDSGHVQEYAVKPPKVPTGVVGKEIGRHVASIDELIGMSQDAALKGGEARAALLDAGNQMAVAQGSIEEAISVIAQIQGQATSALLESYRAILAQVQTDIASLMEQNESIIEAIGAGQERGEEFNGRLLG